MNITQPITDSGSVTLQDSRKPHNGNPRIQRAQPNITLKSMLGTPTYRSSAAYGKSAVNTTILDLVWPHFPNCICNKREPVFSTSWAVLALMCGQIVRRKQTLIVGFHKASTAHVIGWDKRAPTSAVVSGADNPPIDALGHKNSFVEKTVGANELLVVNIPSYTITEKKRNLVWEASTSSNRPTMNDIDCFSAMISRSANVWGAIYPETYGFTNWVSNEGTELYIPHFPYTSTQITFNKVSMETPVLTKYINTATDETNYLNEMRELYNMYRKM